MNLLRAVSDSTLERIRKVANGSDRVMLSDLEHAEVLDGIPDVFRKHVEIGESFLPIQSTREWKDLLAKLPKFPAGDLDVAQQVWTTGIPIGECTLLVPDDGGEASNLQLFTNLAGLWGRLILRGVTKGDSLRVRSASIDFTQHCPTVPCGKDAKCKQWCPECKCQSVIVHGFDCSICWCPVHNDQ